MRGRTSRKGESRKSRVGRVADGAFLRPEPAVASAPMTDTAQLKPVVSQKLPPPAGPYSPGMAVGNLVFVSGQAGRDPKTGNIPADLEGQTEQALKNVEAILVEAGSSLSHVIRCGVFLVDMQEFQKMNGVYSRMFGSHRPARTTVEVSGLPGPGLKVEIDAIAVIPG
jgi:2-iminobutanoate/2-iminopropanoate deaminase